MNIPFISLQDMEGRPFIVNAAHIDSVRAEGWVGPDKALAFNKRADKIQHDQTLSTEDREAKISDLQEEYTKEAKMVSVIRTSSGKEFTVDKQPAQIMGALMGGVRSALHIPKGAA